MPPKESREISALLSEKSKLLIMTALIEAGEKLSFSELAEVADLTNGNLSSHLRKLEDASYVKLNKQFVERRPLTTVEITATGRAAFREHVEGLKAILERIKK